MSGPRQGNPPPPPPEVMTIDELAVYLQVSKSSLYKLAQDGKVPGQKVGRHWRFHKEAIDNWLRATPHAGTRHNV
ncbi:MAG: helix-turn-helix domain-containing protein [Phycisphaerales bacterium]